MIDFSKHIFDYSEDELHELVGIIKQKISDMGYDPENATEPIEVPALTWDDVDNYYDKAAKLTLPGRFGMARAQKKVKTTSNIVLDKSLEQSSAVVEPQDQTTDENAISIFGDDE